MRLHVLIYRALAALLSLNARVYGRGASREVLRDLASEYAPSRDCMGYRS